MLGVGWKSLLKGFIRFAIAVLAISALIDAYLWYAIRYTVPSIFLSGLCVSIIILLIAIYLEI